MEMVGGSSCSWSFFVLGERIGRRGWGRDAPTTAAGTAALIWRLGVGLTGRCHEKKSDHLNCSIDIGVDVGSVGTAGPGGECGDEVRSGAGAGGEERAGLFGDVLVPKRRRVRAGDGGRGGKSNGIRLAIRRWRERQ